MPRSALGSGYSIAFIMRNEPGDLEVRGEVNLVGAMTKLHL
jgi:hypothetical protein